MEERRHAVEETAHGAWRGGAAAAPALVGGAEARHGRRTGAARAPGAGHGPGGPAVRAVAGVPRSASWLATRWRRFLSGGIRTFPAAAGRILGFGLRDFWRGAHIYR